MERHTPAIIVTHPLSSLHTRYRTVIYTPAIERLLHSDGSCPVTTSRLVVVNKRRNGERIDDDAMIRINTDRVNTADGKDAEEIGTVQTRSEGFSDRSDPETPSSLKGKGSAEEGISNV